VSRYLKAGRLYKVITDNFIATPNTKKSANDVLRKILFNKGEIVEFRFECNVNFRTTDGIYCHCSLEYFKEHTELFGQIIEAIRCRNKNTLKEILDCELYDKIKELQDEKTD
jgi:hypothetical protein